MILKRRYWLIAGAACLTGLLIGIVAFLATGQKEEDRAWERILDSGVMRVGMDASYPPFEFIDESTGSILGFDADLAYEIGRRLGLQVEFVNIAYDGLYDALLIGRVDVLISALVASPQVEGKAIFTTPYYNAGEFLVVREGTDIRVMDDLSGHVLAVEYGAGGDVEARKWERRLHDLTIRRYPDPGAAINAVVVGEADAALVDGISARLGVGQHPELILARNVIDNLFSVAVHPDSRTLHSQIDTLINEMFTDGTIGSLVEKWFGPQREY